MVKVIGPTGGQAWLIRGPSNTQQGMDMVGLGGGPTYTLAAPYLIRDIADASDRLTMALLAMTPLNRAGPSLDGVMANKARLGAL